MRVVHLASGLGPTATARHLSLVAPEFGVEQTVLNLGGPDPFGPELRAAGVPVRDVRFRNWLDWTHANTVRSAVAEFRPDVVHVWGNRAAVLANWLRMPGTRPPAAPLIVSDLTPATGWAKKLIDRTRQAATVTRDSPPVLAVPKADSQPDLGLPADARVILNVGGFDATADPLRVANAFEILKHTIPDAHLVMVGDGPLKPQIKELVTRIALDDRRTHFVGLRADVPALLTRAAVVLVAHHKGGRMIVREALAAGKPVVAWRTPEMTAILTETLVPSGDQAGLASAVYRVLSDPAKMVAATAASLDTISLASAARDWLEVYRSTRS